MTSITLNEETLSDIVILSNTPTFLFSRFRRDLSVQTLGERHSALELAKSASFFGSHPNRSFLDKVHAYAHIVALSFKTASDIRYALEQYPPPPVEWALELVKQAIANAVSETRIFVSFISQPVKLIGPNSQASTTKTTLIQSMKPTLVTNRQVPHHSERKVINLD